MIIRKDHPVDFAVTAITDLVVRLKDHGLLEQLTSHELESVLIDCIPDLRKSWELRHRRTVEYPASKSKLSHRAQQKLAALGSQGAHGGATPG